MKIGGYKGEFYINENRNGISIISDLPVNFDYVDCTAFRIMELLVNTKSHTTLVLKLLLQNELCEISSHYYEKSGLNPDNAIAFTQLIQKHMFIPSPEIFGFKPIKEEKYNAIKNIITSKRKLNKIDKYFIVKR